MGAPPSPGLDWEANLDSARWQRVAALLFSQLDTQADATAGEQGSGEKKWIGVPEEVRKALQRHYFMAVARRLAAEQRLVQVLEALAATGVPAIVVKGPAVAAHYPHPEVRDYGDLDLLVKPGHLGQAEGALLGFGYRPYETEQRTLEHGFRHLSPMMLADGHFPVEVHWRLDDPERVGRLPLEELWARAAPWSVKGQPALRLETVDTVLHLCRHAVVQDLLRQVLQPVCDLAQVTKGWDQTQWSALTQRSVDYGLGRAVYIVLILMEQALGLAAPRYVIDELRSASGGTLPAGLVERFLSLETRGAHPVSPTAVRIWTRRTVRARLLYLLQLLFLPRAAMAVVYGVPAGSPRIWLTYLRRPVDLLRGHGRTAWDAIRGDRSARVAWSREVWLEEWLRGEVE
jgi:hypothetical protein